MERNATDMNDELTHLGEELELRLSNWRWPLGVSADEVINETLIRYWRMQKEGSREIRQPAILWLLGTARNIKLEFARRASEMIQSSAANLLVSEPKGCRAASSNFLMESKTWQRFSVQQKHILVESIMFDRPVAEVAAEIQVNRSTAKSWINRLPKRLAKDKALQPFQ